MVNIVWDMETGDPDDFLTLRPVRLSRCGQQQAALTQLDSILESKNVALSDLAWSRKPNLTKSAFGLIMQWLV